MPPRAPLVDSVSHELAELRSAGLWRELKEIASAQEPRVVLDGREVLLFCSNNYLGLANHPSVVAAARDALAKYGASAAASPLVSGHMSIHRALEEKIAAWKGLEAALVCSSGYQANLGVIGALVGRGDVVLSDELNHASIIDGCRLSRAAVRVFRHNDVDHLSALLAESGDARRILIATEAVFSMDGDLAPLREIVALAKQFGAWTLVDEAHSTGVFGPCGAGLAAELGLTREIDVHVGTLGKALGSAGAYVAGSRVLIDLVVNRARSFIYSTGLPPASAAAALAAIDVCEREPERAIGLRQRVARLADRLRAAGLSVPAGDSQILPVRVSGSAVEAGDDARRALSAMRALLDRGVYVAAIRPPTVPPGTSRLRLSVMATHTQQDLDAACQNVIAVLRSPLSRS
ncbi:MAG: 8-amino-7-oxononanoate synthase [Gammaproteobacteria bacterium]|nr:8-amino-7-oxononanoate synthase [Gammaproteobacteria bacterium]